MHQQPLVRALQPAHQDLESLAVGAEADDHQLRAAGSRASTSGQAASSRSTPFDTISLPTKQTTGSRVGSSAASASGAPTSMPAAVVARAHRGQLLAASAARRGEDRRARRSPRRRPARNRSRCAASSQRTSASSSPAPCLRLAGHERVHVDAGRAEEGALAQTFQRHRRPQALGRVARADQDRPRRHEAFAGVRGEPLVVGLQRVLERGAVDLHRVREVAEARARITGPISTWLAKPASMSAASTTSRTAATFASM